MDYAAKTINAPLTMSRSITAVSAEILALKALAFLVNSYSIMDRFQVETGVDVLILRQRAEDPEILAAVVDFLLSDDALLSEFCVAESLDPKALHLARHALPGG